MATIRQLLERLGDYGVEFVIVGGIAAELHGSARVTVDLDICAPLDEPNLRRIVDALGELHPRFRMHPDKPPLYDLQKLLDFKFFNLNLDTDWGVLDILGEITGIGKYPEVAKHAMTMEIHGRPMRVLDLPSLIEAKRKANRLKDRAALPELEHILRRLNAGR